MSISLSGPILENWLLSGEAIHKNISVGGAGLTQIPVPEGKTFIITNIEMLPFANIINDTDLFCDNQSLYLGIAQNLESILTRIQFQLLFYAERINSVYNVRNKFFLSTQQVGDSPENFTNPGVSFEKHSFDTFHIVENNCWLYLKYFNTEVPSSITTDNYNLNFDGSQNWPPTNFYGYTDQSDITRIQNLSAPPGFLYANQGLQQGQIPGTNNQFILPNFDLATSTNQLSNFIPPIAPQSNEDIAPRWLPSIPFYNISVIEVNRRLSTKGLL
jgi:hypothetical protein